MGTTSSKGRNSPLGKYNNSASIASSTSATSSTSSTSAENNSRLKGILVNGKTRKHKNHIQFSNSFPKRYNNNNNEPSNNLKESRESIVVNTHNMNNRSHNNTRTGKVKTYRNNTLKMLKNRGKNFLNNNNVRNRNAKRIANNLNEIKRRANEEEAAEKYRVEMNKKAAEINTIDMKELREKRLRNRREEALRRMMERKTAA